MSAPRHPLFFDHPVSPYSRRVAYALAYKGITVEKVEVDLLHPTEDFLRASDTKTVPALRVFTDGGEANLVESLVILEYLDAAFPGPALYPRTGSGAVDPVKKARLDADIRNYIDGIVPAVGAVHAGKATDKQKEDAKKSMVKLNDEFLAGGQHFGHEVCGEDLMTIADIALLPFIEFFSAFKETSLAEVMPAELSNLWAWFDRMSSQPWVQRNYLGPQATRNYIRLMTEGTYTKLTLPISVYL